MGTVVISMICTMIMWFIGTAFDLRAPGLETALSVATMGGFIMYQLKKKK